MTDTLPQIFPLTFRSDVSSPVTSSLNRIAKSTGPEGAGSDWPEPTSIVGVGAVVSMVAIIVKLERVAFPAGSVAVAVIDWLPSGIGALGVLDQAPPPAAVPNSTALTKRVTVVPAGAVP